VKLFATDLDGTLLSRDDRIHPRDRAALASARERGVVVTIATGRLTSRTHPVARELGLETPLVCCDGGVLACGATERVLRRSPVAVDIAEHVLDVLGATSLARFVMTEAVIHSCERGEPFHPYMRGWANSITTHTELRDADAWKHTPNAPIMVLGIGEAASIDAAQAALAAHAESVDAITFDSSAGRVLRIMAKGASKGAALAELAQQFGIAREHVAVAGDFWNDLSMFEYAGRSFAMPHAPHAVRAAATHALDHDVARHGAFADALDQWLEDLS
jgi:Cof subfamily protein (haloacid dehalogenase superfamily)